MNVNVIDYVEIDKYAVKSYNAINGTNFEPQDIKEWDKDIKVDLIMHGSPCQDFSLAGKQAGAVKGSGTRSSLIYETIRIVNKLKPKYVIWENVKNSLVKPHIDVVNDYIHQLNMLGYNSKLKLTNAAYYGIPQERERVIIVSILGENNFKFPNENLKSNNLEDYIDFREEDDLTLNFYNRYKLIKNSNASIEDFINYINSLPIKKGIGTKKMGLYNFGEMDTITMPTNVTGTLTCRNVQNYNKKYWYNNKLYKPSPKMCWRLMGFNDEDFEKAKKVNDDKHLYNQAGNSIVVKVLEKIFLNLFKGD
jgi:DNA (cytosine-5)-methyltransferase 1